MATLGTILTFAGAPLLAVASLIENYSCIGGVLG
jgi:hypothetical protein